MVSRQLRKDLRVLLGDAQAALAGPLGSRRPCSQSCTVRTLTPIRPAKAACDGLSCAWIARSCAGAATVRVRRLT